MLIEIMNNKYVFLHTLACIQVCNNLCNFSRFITMTLGARLFSFFLWRLVLQPLSFITFSTFSPVKYPAVCLVQLYSRCAAYCAHRLRHIKKAPLSKLKRQQLLSEEKKRARDTRSLCLTICAPNISAFNTQMI